MTKYKRTTKVKTTGMTEEEMSKRLVTNLMAIVGIIFCLVIGIVFFAPLIGSFFGLLSKHRNDVETKVPIKINPPVFSQMIESTKESTASFSGYAQPGSTVKIFVNGPEVGSTLTGADGLFSFTNVALISGKNTIFAKAMDEKGVESDTSQSYSVTVDTKKPELEIESPKDKDTIRNLDKRVLIKGKVNEKSTIRINERLVILKPDLSFEYTLGVSEGTVKIKIEAIDLAGNKEEKELEIKYVKTGQ